MSRGPPRRTFLRVAGSAILALIAGCTSNENPTPSPDQSQAETPTPSPTPTATPSPTPEPTATSSPTPEPVGTGRNPSDLHIINQADSVQSISLQVDKQGGSTVFTETLELDPRERARRDVFANHATGTFVITVQLSNGTEESYEWDLSGQSEDGWVYIAIEADDTIRMTYYIA